MCVNVGMCVGMYVRARVFIEQTMTAAFIINTCTCGNLNRIKNNVNRIRECYHVKVLLSFNLFSRFYFLIKSIHVASLAQFIETV